MSIHRSAKELLDQLHGLIDQLTEVEFQTSLTVLSGSSVGQHIRHTVEFFICLIDGRNDRVINYDLRKHDGVIESDPAIAKSVIGSIISFLNENPEDFDVTFKAKYTIDGEEEIALKSSFYRELAYNIEHAIHHMALIKVGIKSFEREIVLPEYFGVATSTIRYQFKR